MKNLIRNASIYRAEIKQNEDELAEALLGSLFMDPAPSQDESIGFLKTPEGEILRPFSGGYQFTVRIDQKVVPSSALKAEVERVKQDVENNTGRKPGRKELKAIKEDARHTLNLQALSRTTHVDCYYHVTQNLLIVTTTSQKVCDKITHLLVNALETMKTSTIHVSVGAGLTTRLQQWVRDQGDSDAFGDLEPTGRATLISVEDRRAVSVKSDSLMTNIDALREALTRGYAVKNLSLSMGDLSFVLTDTFKFGSISNTPSGEPADSEESDWASSAFIEVAALVEAVNAMCAMFGHGGEESAEGEQQ